MSEEKPVMKLVDYTFDGDDSFDSDMFGLDDDSFLCDTTIGANENDVLPTDQENLNSTSQERSRDEIYQQPGRQLSYNKRRESNGGREHSKRSTGDVCGENKNKKSVLVSIKNVSPLAEDSGYGAKIKDTAIKQVGSHKMASQTTKQEERVVAGDDAVINMLQEIEVRIKSEYVVKSNAIIEKCFHEISNQRQEIGTAFEKLNQENQELRDRCTNVVDAFLSVVEDM